MSAPADFTIKRGDRLPPIQATLKDAAGTAVNLTGATVTLLMTAQGASSPSVNAAATVTNAAGGQVQYDWGTSDTATAGTYYAEFEVTFASGKKQTFPNDRHLVVVVYGDLG